MKRILCAILAIISVCTAGLTSCKYPTIKQHSEPSSLNEDNSENAETEEEPTDDFSDAAFIGGARTEGLRIYGNKNNSTFLCAANLNLNTVDTNENIKFDKESGTIFQAVKKSKYNRIFIEFGIDEAGWSSKETFQENYEDIVNRIKDLQPDAEFYLLAEPPVSSKALKSGKHFTNENIDAINSCIEKAAENTDCHFIDTNSPLKDDDGALPDDASSNGINLNSEYSLKWMDIIEENASDM